MSYVSKSLNENSGEQIIFRLGEFNVDPIIQPFLPTKLLERDAVACVSGRMLVPGVIYWRSEQQSR